MYYPKTRKMKKKTILLLPALWGLMAACQENFDERCAREAREYTEKQCPRRMDICTIMDSLTYDEATHTLNYYYTLEGELDTDSMMNKENCGKIEDLLRKNIINSVELKTYKENGINFSYCYHSKTTGKARLQVRFTPEDYGNGIPANDKK